MPFIQASSDFEMDLETHIIYISVVKKMNHLHLSSEENRSISQDRNVETINASIVTPVIVLHWTCVQVILNNNSLRINLPLFSTIVPSDVCVFLS